MTASGDGSNNHTSSCKRLSSSNQGHIRAQWTKRSGAYLWLFQAKSKYQDTRDHCRWNRGPVESTSQADRDPPNKLFYPIQKDQSFIYKKVMRETLSWFIQKEGTLLQRQKGSLLRECSSRLWFELWVDKHPYPAEGVACALWGVVRDTSVCGANEEAGTWEFPGPVQSGRFRRESPTRWLSLGISQLRLCSKSPPIVHTRWKRVVRLCLVFECSNGFVQRWRRELCSLFGIWFFYLYF